MNKMSPAKVALTDQIIAVLRDAERPFTTDDIAARVNGSGLGTEPGNHCPTCACVKAADDYDWRGRVPPWDVRLLLDRLSRRGVVMRVRYEGQRPMFWRVYTEQDAVDKFNSSTKTASPKETS